MDGQGGADRFTPLAYLSVCSCPFKSGLQRGVTYWGSEMRPISHTSLLVLSARSIVLCPLCALPTAKKCNAIRSKPAWEGTLKQSPMPHTWAYVGLGASALSGWAGLIATAKKAIGYNCSWHPVLCWALWVGGSHQGGLLDFCFSLAPEL